MAFEGKKQGKKWRSDPRPVADLVSGILDKVVQQRAGMTMQLVMSWEDIIGPDHAAYTRPEKLEWPKSHSDSDPFQPATLRIACDGARAVYVQHEAGAIVGRVNTFFGFSAVNRIRIVQKPVLSAARKKIHASKPLDPDQEQRLDEMLQTVEDDSLRKALKKMGKGVFSSGSQKPG